MRNLKLYFATNRRHKGRDRWRPTSYGPEFSSDGMENLRFGKVTVQVDPARLRKHLSESIDFGIGNGNALSGYLAGRADSSRSRKIEAFSEKLLEDRADDDQPRGAHGSVRMFDELQQRPEL